MIKYAKIPSRYFTIRSRTILEAFRKIQLGLIFTSNTGVYTRQEGPVISAHSVQVARFLFIDLHMRKGRGTTPKIVESLNFAPLRYSLNNCLHRH